MAEGVGDLGQTIERIVIEGGDRIVGRYRIVLLRLRLDVAVVAGWPRAIVGVTGDRGVGGVQFGGQTAQAIEHAVFALHDSIARIEHFFLGAVAHQVQGVDELVAGGISDLNQAMGGVVGFRSYRLSDVAGRALQRFQPRFPILLLGA